LRVGSRPVQERSAARPSTTGLHVVGGQHDAARRQRVQAPAVASSFEPMFDARVVVALVVGVDSSPMRSGARGAHPSRSGAAKLETARIRSAHYASIDRDHIAQLVTVFPANRPEATASAGEAQAPHSPAIIARRSRGGNGCTGRFLACGRAAGPWLATVDVVLLRSTREQRNTRDRRGSGKDTTLRELRELDARAADGLKGKPTPSPAPEPAGSQRVSAIGPGTRRASRARTGSRAACYFPRPPPVTRPSRRCSSSRAGGEFGDAACRSE
jgi:hypothetical protein